LQASKVYTISLHDKRFASIDPNAFAEYCELRSLDLTFNRLRTLAGIERVTSLRELDCSTNRLTAVSHLPALTLLEALLLGDNRITSSVGIGHLRKLRVLDLKYNELAQLDQLHGLKSLTQLDLTGNQLTSLNGLSGCVALETLVADRNQLASFSGIEHNVQLSELSCRYNKVSQPTGLQGLTNLTELHLTGNVLTKLGAFPALPLVELHLGENSVVSLEGIERKFPYLEVLDASGNQLESMPAIAAVRCLSELTELMLNSNAVCDDAGYEPFVQSLSDGVRALEIIDGHPLSAHASLAARAGMSLQGLRPGSSSAQHRPGSAIGSRPGSALAGSRPVSAASSRPGSASAHRIEPALVGVEAPPVMPTRNLSLRTMAGTDPLEILQQMRNSVLSTRSHIDRMLTETRQGLEHREEQARQQRPSTLELRKEQAKTGLANGDAAGAAAPPSRTLADSASTRGRIAEARSFATKLDPSIAEAQANAAPPVPEPPNPYLHLLDRVMEEKKKEMAEKWRREGKRQ
jgi:hypothetical protein